MKATPLDIPDVVLVEPDVFEDHRGFFFESWNERRFNELVGPTRFVQDNHSMSEAGTIRGLHYQVRRPQGKLVRVVRGAAFDVAVDLRQSSQTFGRWVGIELTATSKQQIWVPPGFAHGFMSLVDGTEILYKATDYYAPDLERSLAWDDPDLSIGWPVLDGDVFLSERDRHAARLRDAEVYQ